MGLVDPVHALHWCVCLFIVVYLHMYRALLYGSYKSPRELLWLNRDVYIFHSDGGSVLWVSVTLGADVVWGLKSSYLYSVLFLLSVMTCHYGYVVISSVSDVTLNRFFALHVIALPLVLCGLVVAHILALHEVGSNNPDGIEIKSIRTPMAFR